MSGFPPAKASRKAPVQPEEAVKNPVSTGKGGLTASIKVKNAGTTPSAGVEKNVNAF